MEDDLREKLMIKFAGLQPKTCSNLTDDSDEDKESKGKKKTKMFRFQNKF